MHSSKFVAIAQQADEFSHVVIAAVEDIRESTDEVTHAAAILMNPDSGRFAYANVIVTGTEVEFTRIQEVGANVSKAYKYLSDYTLDRRPMRHVESGAEIEQAREALAA